MAFEQITYETRGEVAILTLNRPDRLNAWTYKMKAEQVEAVEAANADPAIGAIIMTGAGKGFCAGADISDSFNARLSGDDPSDGEDAGGEPTGSDWVDLCGRSKPLIAAINGPAVGIGITMALPFDVILASEEARIGMFFVRMGLVPELASSHFLERRVGFGRANEMCLTAALYDAATCHDYGLVDRLCKPESLMDEAMELGRQISRNPDRQLRMIKGLLRQNGPEADLGLVQKREHELLNECYTSPEHKEAVDAFLNKREAKFR
ncbi:MAG: enoyl-CoA hydratase-related protein [Alphaproteobacteria bacterium]|nr:enoyl-CoA hydratase-related protein [Alphaproteobacteria bacterium]